MKKSLSFVNNYKEPSDEYKCVHCLQLRHRMTKEELKEHEASGICVKTLEPMELDTESGYESMENEFNINPGQSRLREKRSKSEDSFMKTSSADMKQKCAMCKKTMKSTKFKYHKSICIYRRFTKIGSNQYYTKGVFSTKLLAKNPAIACNDKLELTIMAMKSKTGKLKFWSVGGQNFKIELRALYEDQSTFKYSSVRSLKNGYSSLRLPDCFKDTSTWFFKLYLELKDGSSETGQS